MPPKPVRTFTKQRIRHLIRAIKASRLPEVEADGWYWSGLLPYARYQRVMRWARRRRKAQRAEWLRYRLRNLPLPTVTQ